MTLISKRQKDYELIVFDWDGTLMDSTSAIVSCIQSACVDLGFPAPSDDIASHVIGLGLHDALARAVPNLAVEDYPKLSQRYVAHYLTRDHELRLFNGVRELLTALQAQGHMLAVATGKSRKGLNRALTYTGLGPNFVLTRCADETFSKPHPAMLLELAESLAVPLDRVLMIGDTTHDIEMAHNAGTDALAVTYGAHPRDVLNAARPLHCIDSVSAMHEWLLPDRA